MNKEQQLDFLESQISGTQPYVDILEKVPDLTFTLDRMFSGVNSVVIEFHTSDGRHGAELMEFKNGRVARVIAHYVSEGT